MARAEIRGSHARPAQLEATLKKVGGSTNVALFSSNSISSFPISRSATTSNELFAGTWELCVRDTQRGDVGRIDGWSIVLEQAPGGGVNNGNNNGGAQAGVVAVTANTTRQDSIENNVQDWFSIALTQGQTLTVSTAGSCAQEQAAPVVSIHAQLPVNRPTWASCPTQGSADWTNATTQSCADDGGETYCTTTNARAAVTGTYYVRVIGYDNEYPGAYSITFNVR
jgi:hypothetical protein